MVEGVRYCETADGVAIAYAVTDGSDADPVLVLRVPWIAGLEPVKGFFDWHLAGASIRIARFSPRGSGLSDRDVSDHSLEARLADIDAVASAVGAERYVLFAMADTTMAAMAWAARNPDRVSKLLLQSPVCNGEVLWSTPRRSLLARMAAEDWEMFSEVWPLALWGWDTEVAARRRYAAAIRQSISQETFLAYVAASRETDVSDCLHYIETPSLLITGTELGAGGSHHHAFNNTAAMRAVAAGLPNTRLVATKPDTYGPIIREFLAVEELPPETDRPAPWAVGAQLRTILFTDIEGHTEMMARLGDSAGRDVLREHERITRQALRVHGGAEVKAMGDGFLAWFPSATRALECAVALQKEFEAHNLAGGEPLRVRVGVNAGEPLQEGGDLFGQAVIIASRVAASATGGEIAVTDVVRQLVAGKSFVFADRGSAALKGLDEPVRTWALVW
ncbi:MAG: adenylate/guanylate cyclase domain-containing protein [Dehalococcoidia bacterium]